MLFPVCLLIFNKSSSSIQYYVFVSFKLFFLWKSLKNTHKTSNISPKYVDLYTPTPHPPFSLDASLAALKQ